LREALGGPINAYHLWNFTYQVKGMSISQRFVNVEAKPDKPHTITLPFESLGLGMILELNSDQAQKMLVALMKDPRFLP